MPNRIRIPPPRRRKPLPNNKDEEEKKKEESNRGVTIIKMWEEDHQESGSIVESEGVTSD